MDQAVDQQRIEDDIDSVAQHIGHKHAFGIAKPRQDAVKDNSRPGECQTHQGGKGIPQPQADIVILCTGQL